MRITFEISDSDIRHFKRAMRRARSAVRSADEEDIIHAGEDMLREVRRANVPAYVQERMDRLHALIDMLRDEEWLLPAKERSQVLSALAYCADPEDLIPDHIPGFGFLDDAIIVELVLKDMKHVVDAFVDFREYRETLSSRLRSGLDRFTRKRQLADRRKALHLRMRRRRQKDMEAREQASQPSPLF